MITRKNDASKLALETLDARLANAEARLATHSSSESSLDQLTWPSFDADCLNGLQPPQGAEQTDPPSDINDLFPPLPSSETSSEHNEVGKRRTTFSDMGEATEDTMPLFLSSLDSDIHTNLPRDEL
ncbi:MAG: hypothetical protein LQ337_007924 [Flavoplaca oasis]|nr:MAG: hypothetical protein LQ337_007924 [Flavoplaca oasis]